MSLDKTVLARLALILSLALGATAIAHAPVSADPGGPPGPQPADPAPPP
jgi:hypothetical protein